MSMRILEIKDMLDAFPDFDVVLGTVYSILDNNPHLTVDLPISNSTACASHIYKINTYFAPVNRQRRDLQLPQIVSLTYVRNKPNDGCSRCHRDNINMVVRLSIHKEDEEE